MEKGIGYLLQLLLISETNLTWVIHFCPYTCLFRTNIIFQDYSVTFLNNIFTGFNAKILSKKITKNILTITWIFIHLAIECILHPHSKACAIAKREEIGSCFLRCKYLGQQQRGTFLSWVFCTYKHISYSHLEAVYPRFTPVSSPGLTFTILRYRDVTVA